MKKNKLTRAASFMLALFVAAGMLIVSTGPAEAKSSWEIYLASTMFSGQNDGVTVGSNGKEAKIKSVKSSNKKVIRVTKFKTDDGKTHYQIDAKKAGKAKLTVEYKIPGGKVKTLKKSIKVLPYPKHIKSLKINGKKIKAKGDRRYFYSDSDYQGDSARVKLAVKDGWKISGVYGGLAYRDRTKADKEIKNAKKLITSGKKLSFPEEYQGLYYIIEMKKDDKFISYYVSLWRK